VRAHTPPGTETVLTISETDGLAVIEIADNGPGLPAERTDRVFDRFYRGDGSRSRESGGSGLGLAIVRAIVLKHGGSVAAANGATGGAVFTIRLPLSAASSAQAPGTPTQPSARPPRDEPARRLAGERGTPSRRD
jgi:two-component system, OmpR family, sensor kinase